MKNGNLAKSPLVPLGGTVNDVSSPLSKEEKIRRIAKYLGGLTPWRFDMIVAAIKGADFLIGLDDLKAFNGRDSNPLSAHDLDETWKALLRGLADQGDVYDAEGRQCTPYFNGEARLIMKSSDVLWSECRVLVFKLDEFVSSQGQQGSFACLSPLRLSFLERYLSALVQG